MRINWLFQCSKWWEILVVQLFWWQTGTRSVLSSFWLLHLKRLGTHMHIVNYNSGFICVLNVSLYLMYSFIDCISFCFCFSGGGGGELFIVLSLCNICSFPNIGHDFSSRHVSINWVSAFSTGLLFSFAYVTKILVFSCIAPLFSFHIWTFWCELSVMEEMYDVKRVTCSLCIAFTHTWLVLMWTPYEDLVIVLCYE